ncbi:MAG: DUF2057 domain-containing protein [Colwellia sp.]|nr:DUF2057 domain-containing protein [Colwellia sp.]MCW8865735.1 DUF2057 domain-containing protein [Colwellia sp.]MCW9080257.1 DUF2057 domain-containing protein [Colwellia sp.]
MTRLFYIFCLGLLSTVTSFTPMAATLTVADNLIVSELDDKVVEHGFIGKKSTFELNQGEHALIVRYKDVFEDLDFAEDRVVESQDFVVKFSLTNQQQLTLTTAAIKNLKQAERFAKAPEIMLIDEKNKPLVIELVEVSDYKLVKQVNIAVSSITAHNANHNASPRIANTQSNSTKKQAAPISDNSLIQVDSLTMLKYWWQTASKTEKDQFKQFLKNK